MLGNFVLTFNGSNTAPVFAVAGDFTVNNTGTGTLQLTSSNAQTDITVSGNYIQNNASNVYIVRNTSNNTNRYFRVLGNFTLNGTSLFNVVSATGGNANNTGTLEVGGNLVMTPTATLTKTSSGASTVASIGTLNFTGSVPQSAVFGIVTNVNAGSGPATGVFNMAVTGTGGVTLNSNLVAPGNLSLTNGDFLVPVTRTLTLSPNSTNCPGASTLAISFGKTLTINGTVLNQGTFLTPGSWAPASTFGNWIVNNGGTYIHNTTGGISGPLTTSTLGNSSNFIYRGGVPTAGLIPAISISGKTYGNLTFESYSGAVAMPGPIGSSGAGTLTINGNLSIGGTAGLGTVSYSLATAPGYTGDVNVGGDITIVSGNTFTANTNNISLKGNWSNAGSFVCGSSNVIFNSTTSAQTYTQTGTGNFYGLTNSNTSPSGTVTLNNNAAVEDFLTLNNTSVLNLATGNLNLLSTATKTARVTPVTGGATLSYGSGRAFVQRYMPARRAWRLMAAPLDPAGGTHTISEAWQEGQTDYTTDTSATGGFATQITGGSLANGFDQSQTGSSSIKYFSAGSWLTPANTNATSVNSKEGWMLFVRGDRKNYGLITNQYKAPTTTTLRPRGQLFIGSKSITSTGMTVVGNPYASAVDYNTMTKTGSGWPFNSTYYVWDPYLGGAQGVGAFVTLTWNGTDFTRSAPLSGSGTSTYDNRYIPSGAAIIVDFPPSATLQIKETDKNANNTTNAFRPGPSRQLMTVLNTVNADSTTYVSDGALNLFGNDFNDAADFNDAVKLGNFNENIVIKRDAKLLSIERRTVPKDADTIFYGLYRLQQKTYQLQFNMENIGAHPSLRAFLEDTYLGTKTPVSLTGTTAVEFKVTANAASAAADRFRLVFRKIVKFKTVTAAVANSDVKVEWKVANEAEVNNYVVERSSNGTSFTESASVDSKGNSDNTVSYSWIDAGLEPGEYFYRIKSVENNGTVSFSDVVKVKIVKKATGLFVYPNPVTDNRIHLQLNNEVAGNYVIRLSGASGQLVHKEQVTYAGGISAQTIIPSAELESGTYQLEVIGPDKKVTVIPIVINRM